MARLLIVEDQKKLVESLQQGLQEEGYEVRIATSGEEGYALATSESFDAIILDVMLPGRDGFTVLSDLRRHGFTRPIVMLTARDAIDDRVHGLDSGADDYLVKPFVFAELVARIRALLRRDTTGRELTLHADNLEMDLTRHRVSRAGHEIELTRREFELLEYLLRNKNVTVTRDMMARDVWKETTGCLTNVIDVYINILRKKLEKSDGPSLIYTVRGVGYALREPSCVR